MQTLLKDGYESDPVKAWKVAQEGGSPDISESDDEESVATAGSGSGPDFNYLLNMPIVNLTKEKKDEMLKQKDAKVGYISSRNSFKYSCRFIH